ncbi:MAG: TrkA family potassium uptake protein [Candidatus Aminicenantes bacterium]|nr:TrkA family potassium uptake protein [Candidatus Aminicenantes bacterium]
MKFAVIGLGSFGSNVARTLYEKGHEVLAIDTDKNKIEEAKSFSSHAVITDASEMENLEALEIKGMDVVVVSLGEAMEASILTVLHLHEMGARRIVAKASTEDHGKILEAIGATEVINPEKDMAIRTALRLTSPAILECLPLMSGISIQEIAPPERFIGKSLKQLDLRNKYEIQVIAIRELVPERTVYVPKADFVIKDSDILIVMGDEKKLEKITSL